MPDYDPDQHYFRQLGEQTQSLTPIGKAVLTGYGPPIWECSCFHRNTFNCERCNNCGEPKPIEREAA